MRVKRKTRVVSRKRRGSRNKRSVKKQDGGGEYVREKYALRKLRTELSVLRLSSYNSGKIALMFIWKRMFEELHDARSIESDYKNLRNRDSKYKPLKFEHFLKKTRLVVEKAQKTNTANPDFDNEIMKVIKELFEETLSHNPKAAEIYHEMEQLVSKEKVTYPVPSPETREVEVEAAEETAEAREEPSHVSSLDKSAASNAEGGHTSTEPQYISALMFNSTHKCHGYITGKISKTPLPPPEMPKQSSEPVS